MFDSISSLEQLISNSEDNGLSLFFDTVLLKDKAKIEFFRVIDFDLNIQDKLGKNILSFMIDCASRFESKKDKFDFLDYIKYLLNIGVSANLKDNTGATSLHKAVLKGCPDLVKTLLDYGDARIVVCDNLGRTPLHNCVWNNDLKNAQRLLRFNKKTLSISDYAGFYPINYASIMGLDKLVMFLIEQNSPIKNNNKKGIKTVEFMQKHIMNLDKLNSKISNEYVFKYKVEELIKNMKSELFI